MAKATSKKDEPKGESPQWKAALEHLEKSATLQKKKEPSYYINYVKPCEEKVATGNRSDDLLTEITNLLIK